MMGECSFSAQTAARKKDAQTAARKKEMRRAAGSAPGAATKRAGKAPLREVGRLGRLGRHRPSR
jgi:hypothetical protein